MENIWNSSNIIRDSETCEECEIETTKTLLVVFLNGERHYIDDVSTYGRLQGDYFYIKNEKMAYIPSNNVMYFGESDIGW